MKKKLIRNSVYETNSSSSHSISLATPDMGAIMDTIYPNEYGIIYVNGGEFGWEWERFNDAETKLNYAFQDNVNEDLLRKVVMKQTGAINVVFGNKDDGYIDHESYGNANKVCIDEESTRNFIFNLNSWLFTGNDNTNPHICFHDVPIYTKDGIIEPKYSYELTVDGFDKKVQLMSYPNFEKVTEALESLLDNVNFKFIEDKIIGEEVSDYYNRHDFIFDHNSEIDYESGQIKIYNNSKYYQLRRKMISNGWDYDKFHEMLLLEKDISITINFYITEI